jgi:hypothetical protein
MRLFTLCAALLVSVDPSPIGPQFIVPRPTTVTASSLDCTVSTCYYIRDGGSASTTGTGACVSTGSGNWNTANACDDLPATKVRGAYYLVASGTYGNWALNTAVSGTTRITIRGATTTDHGTSTGWLSSYGVDVTQATIGNPTFTKGYFTLDGAVGGLEDATLRGSANIRSTYGFAVTQTLTGANDAAIYLDMSTGGGSIPSAEIVHVAMLAPGTFATSDETAIRGSNSGGSMIDLHVHSSLMNHFQGDVVSEGGPAASTGWIVEYNWFENHFSSTLHHGESINANGNDIDGLVLRYNVFHGTDGGQTAVVCANNSPLINALIYGNVFDGTKVGNGIISSTGTGTFSNSVVYNNSFLNNDSGDTPGAPISWVNGTNITTENNLLYNQPADISGTGTNDYDAYFSVTTTAPTETHRQTGSGNPFVSSATFNYHLLTATTAGLALASPYTLDPLGNTRGADGTWDRGAYEFCSGGCTFALLPRLGQRYRITVELLKRYTLPPPAMVPGKEAEHGEANRGRDGAGVDALGGRGVGAGG